MAFGVTDRQVEDVKRFLMSAPSWVFGKELAGLIGDHTSNYPKVRECIHRLRVAHCPVIASTSKGYRWSSSAEDVEADAVSLIQRARSILDVAAAEMETARRMREFG